MIIVTTILGVALVVGQGLLLYGFLRIVQSFGAFTESYRTMTTTLLTTLETNQTLHADNRRILEELKRLHKPQKAGAA